MSKTCPTCGGTGMVACPGPAKSMAERRAGKCYGMHMGHPCPACRPLPREVHDDMVGDPNEGLLG